MKKSFIISIIFYLLVAGCTKEMTNQPLINKTPRTYLWLQPDSNLALGNSKQHIYWIGDDPDGIVTGYLFASGKILDSAGRLSNNIPWGWRVKNDTIVAFPLFVPQDTFQVCVRAVDNNFIQYISDFHGRDTIRDQDTIYLGNPPYWDRNGNGQFDSSDAQLPSLLGTYDPKGALLGFPILNQPPSVTFTANPNDRTIALQQPETTFTAASFAWKGSDPDGNSTIVAYQIALNNTTDTTKLVTLRADAIRTPGDLFGFDKKDTISLITLFVPRQRSNDAIGEVNADIYSKQFTSLTQPPIGTIPGLKLDSNNTFYVRAIDIAGEVSPFIQMPAQNASHKWFVKKPKSKLLVVADYINNVVGTPQYVLSIYRTVFQQFRGGEFGNFDIIDIGKGLSSGDKDNGKFGNMVPGFIDPAFYYTLHLFEIVFWYTDPSPSLGVAQGSLFEYIHDINHKGKVIFSMMFKSAVDPRSALKDFAPIDSVSTFPLATYTKYPAFCANTIPKGYMIYPDSSISSRIFPPLRFNNEQFEHSVFMRPIFKGSYSRYIYRLQEDVVRVRGRYEYSITRNELKSITATNANTAWICGETGTILFTSDAGNKWTSQRSGTADTLNSIYFINEQSGWAGGNNGTFIATVNGGNTWGYYPINNPTIDILSVKFSDSKKGIAVGTNGLLIHTTDGGVSWLSTGFRTNRTLRAVDFFDSDSAIAVGDSGFVIRSTDGGSHWYTIPTTVTRNLNTIKFINSTDVWAAGEGGTNLKSVNAGNTWETRTIVSSRINISSISFADNNSGFVCGSGGLLYKTNNGGNSWFATNTTIGGEWNLNSVVYLNPTQAFSVGSDGIILRTEDGGNAWSTQPKGKINVGVIDGDRRIVFLSIPLHLLNGDGTNIASFFDYVISHEFGY